MCINVIKNQHWTFKHFTLAEIRANLGEKINMHFFQGYKLSKIGFWIGPRWSSKYMTILLWQFKFFVEFFRNFDKKIPVFLLEFLMICNFNLHPIIFYKWKINICSKVVFFDQKNKMGKSWYFGTKKSIKMGHFSHFQAILKGLRFIQCII